MEASYGLGDMIVSGKVDPDDYIIDRETLIIKKKKIGEKGRMSMATDEHTKIIDTEKIIAKNHVLNDGKIKELAEICLKVEKNI